jgi:pimeloyl-ACP methyl ester carboxylesterase
MRYPERVRRLVAIGAKLWCNRDPAKPYKRSRRRTLIHRGLLAKKSVLAGNLSKGRYDVADRAKLFAGRDLGQIKAPIIIMAGRFDIIKRGHTAKLAKAIPGSQKVIVNCATHTVPMISLILSKRLFFNFLERGGWVP